MFSLRYFKDHNGKPLWIAGMCAIGPFTTPDPKKALAFETERAAKLHPAWNHPTCLCEVEPHPIDESDPAA